MENSFIMHTHYIHHQNENQITTRRNRISRRQFFLLTVVEWQESHGGHLALLHIDNHLKTKISGNIDRLKLKSLLKNM